MIKKLVFGSICVVLLLSLCACSGSKFPYGTFVSEDGAFQMTLNKDGSIIFKESNGGVLDTGNFSVKGNEYTIIKSVGCASLDAEKATYTWTYKNDILILSLKGKDYCTPRRDDLNHIRYHLQK